MATNPTEGHASAIHKFQIDSGMTSEEVFDFAFKEYLIPILQNLSDGLELGDFLEALATAATKHGAQVGQAWAASIPRNDMATWTAWMDDMDNPFHDRLTFEVIERTDHVCEIKITECLWAKTFREAGAPEMGYAVCCAGDWGMCQAFNPEIKLTRTKTLMKGDECCNYRWEWKE